MRKYQITEWCLRFIRDHVKEGDICIDATAGNGNDTLALCQLVGEAGKVIAFDIQETAIDNTKKRLLDNGVEDRAEVYLESHTKMDKYAQENSVSCIVFNFGYLPGGDHNLSTRKESSIEAIHTGLRLLRKGGLMSLCIYSVGDSGFEERDAILEELKTLDGKKYLVIKSEYYNRPNNPPMPVMIIKM